MESQAVQTMSSALGKVAALRERLSSAERKTDELQVRLFAASFRDKLRGMAHSMGERGECICSAVSREFMLDEMAHDEPTCPVALALTMGRMIRSAAEEWTVK